MLRCLTALMVSMTFLASCGGSHSSSNTQASGARDSLSYAEFFSIERLPDYTAVTVRNPWDSVRMLQKYILVKRDSVLPENLPQGIIVKVPLSNSLVLSTVHTSLLSELNAAESIGGVCSAEYIKGDALVKRLKSGDLADCGDNMNPNIEKVIKLNPDAILLSPYENNDRYARVADLGIPIIECADYMETSPLGRAEWVKFFGLLFGREDEAQKMFAETEKRYLDLKELAATAKDKPKVLTDTQYGQTWGVPSANSTTGRYIEDAGGTNPFAKYNQTGSVQLAPEKVLAEAHDADVWFIKYNQQTEKSLKELSSDAPVNSRFKAFKDGNVFGCNTRYVNLFEETPFHPDLMLEEMIKVIHPELFPDQPTLRYYQQMK